MCIRDRHIGTHTFVKLLSVFGFIHVDEIHHDFPAARILRELGAHEGGEVRLALTKIGNDCWAIRLK